MQSIQATFVPATNTKPNRIKVSTASGSKVYTFPSDCDSLEGGYVQVVKEYVKFRDWNVKTMYYGGNAAQTGYNFVIVTDYAKVEL